MNIKGKKIWQQAAGDTNHDYVDLCLKWGVILSGPAIYGRWEDQYGKILLDDHWSSKKVTNLYRFCVTMEEADLVVLRLGTSFVYAVGVIAGSYEYHEEFNDVDGWDIAHVRRIRWLWRYDGKKPKEFETYTLKLGDTTQLLKSPDEAPEVYEWLENLDVPDDAYNRLLVELPANNDKDVDVDHISEYLFEKGVASSSISNLMNEIGEFIRIANWYRNEGMPSEHETVTYLVIPLLRALGWTPQKMAIEWGKIDIALFSNLPRGEQSLSAIVEAKKMDNSCLSALPQAEDYARKYKHCGRVIVTDGLRYGVFSRKVDDSKKEWSLHAYMNLTRLRGKYPLYGKCMGAQGALLAMTPEWSKSMLESSVI